MRRLLSHLPQGARGAVWATTRETYAVAARIVSRRTLSRRRRAAKAAASTAAFAVPRSLGVAVIPPGRFPEAGEVVKAAQGILERTDMTRAEWTNKEQFTNLLDMSTLTLDSPFMRFALREDVVASLAQYLGMVPVLRYVGVWYSRHIERAPYSSQLYHLDGEGPSQLKIFLLCSEVSTGSGPLTIVGADASRRINRAVRYRVRGGRLDDEQVRRVTGGRDEHVLTGSPETVGVVDTDRCFHFGSRVDADAPPRLVATFQYVTPLSFRLSFGRKLPLKHLSSPSLPPLARLVLGDDADAVAAPARTARR